MKKLKILVTCLNVSTFIFALIGTLLVINLFSESSNTDIVLSLIHRNYLFGMLGIVFLIKIADNLLKKVYPTIKKELYSSKILYDIGLFYFEFLVLVFLFPGNKNTITIMLYFIARWIITSIIAKQIIKKSTPSG